VTTHVRFDVIFNDHFTANLLEIFQRNVENWLRFELELPP